MRPHSQKVVPLGPLSDLGPIRDRSYEPFHSSGTVSLLLWIARGRMSPHPLIAQLFVLVEQPRHRLSHWLRALARLDSPNAPRIAAVVAHYDVRADEAMLELQYDRCGFDEQGRRFVVDVALVAEVGVIQPDELSDEQRRRFLDARLARCTLRFAPQASVTSALTHVARKLAATPPPIPAARQAKPALGTPPPTMRSATGTGTRNAAPIVQEVDDDSSETSPYQGPRVAARGSSPPRYQDQDRITSPLDLTVFQARAAARNAPAQIDVQYFRGGRLMAARVSAISLNGAALVTTALPRVNERVDVALSFGKRRVVVRGIVAKASTRDEATSVGAGLFTVKFVLDDSSRDPLFSLLLAARDASVTIKPPPRRAFRRLPVERLVALRTANDLVNATALDVSVGGMFVRLDVPLLLDSTLRFSLVLDDGDAAIAGRASVVRRISDADADARCLVAGFGLAIIDMEEHDRVRWHDFLARVERRAEKKVLIGAPPARFAELRAGLASLGYAVIGGTDPRTLLRLANDHVRPADAALIDAGWLRHEPSTAGVEELLASRSVPCVKVQGHVLRARQAIDRLLDVL